MTAGSSPLWKPFSHAENEPFLWKQGQRAALLIHGFAGTPAEMRALGVLLNNAGWTVHAPLLPGFGPEIETLPDRSYQEWVQTVRTACESLQREHETILLVGNSMGGALALRLAEENLPAGMVLLAPFICFAVWWHNLLWPAVRRFVPELKPFQHADFSSPQVRRMVRRMCDGANPDDAAVQQHLRAIGVSIRALDQLKELGRSAFIVAPRVNTETLILQGRHDLLVSPRSTRTLARRFPKPPQYLEFDGGHDLVEPEGPAWPDVARHVLGFAQGLNVADQR